MVASGGFTRSCSTRWEESRAVYRHTQVGYLTLIVILVAALGIVASLPDDVRPVTLGVAGLMVIIGPLWR